MQPLEAVCRIVNGGTPKTGVPEYWGGEHRWITPAEMGRRTDPYVGTTTRTLTDLGLSSCSATLSPPNSVVLSTRAPIGHLIINTEPMATNQGCRTLVPGPRIQHKYLYYYLDSIRDVLDALGTGATFRELSAGVLRSVTIPVPSLPEQQRVVDILDKAFEDISTAKANSEKNLHNARTVFQSRLQFVFTTSVDGSVERRLSDLCDRITVGHVGSMAAKYKPSGIPFLRSQNIHPFEVVLDNVVFIDDVFHQSLAKSRLKPGDLAIVRTGYPGTAAVIPPELPDSNCADLVIVRPGPQVLPEYLAAFFNSDFGKALVGGKLVGSAQKHFNVTAAKGVLLRLPPLNTQREIVDMVHALRDETRRMESVFRRKLAALEELKVSLLREAFSGGLTKDAA